jgi:hypothetical protein
MTHDATATTEVRVAPAFGPGIVLAVLVFIVYGGLALTVDFPRAIIGIHADDATYYMLGHSLAEDGDITYRREDLMRVWKEFDSGPTGLFLKRGVDVLDAGLMLRPPFVWTRWQPDPDQTRFFYAKSFIYPLFAAPFVRIFGTNGFLMLHAVLLALVVWCGFLFLRARMPAGIAALLSGAFVMVTIVPVYFVWISPEVFNFSLIFLAYFCWLYKEVATPAHVSRRMQWLMTGRSDIVAAILLGVMTFSKPPNALLFVPIGLWLLWHRRIGRLVVASAAFLSVAIGLFAINMAVSGEWNYQGGARKTFAFEFPFQTPQSDFNTIVEDTHGRDEALTDIIFGPMFWPNLRNNIRWFFVGRNGGLIPYFFPAVFALALYLGGVRRRPAWQHLVFAGALMQIVFYIVTVPYTWNGGGGSVGNRYFVGPYAVFLFLLPPVTRVAATVIPWAIGALFTAPLVLNPFVTSFKPGDHTKSGPFRWLPMELTLIYDWPITNQRDRVMRWFGDNPPDHKDPGFQIYFFDDNAYIEAENREAEKIFWVKGEARAEYLIKTDRPMKRLLLNLSAGAEPVSVVARLGGRTQTVSLGAGASQQIQFSLDDGFRYQGIWPVWTASISASAGFVPIFYEANSKDNRFLGVRVKPVLVE